MRDRLAERGIAPQLVVTTTPKPIPGETHTLACSSSRLENSREPSARYASGMRAQMYIEAFGHSTGQPASVRPL